MRRALFALGALGGAASVVACAGLLGFDRLSSEGAPDVATQPDGGGTDAPVVLDAADECTHARWPDNPRTRGGGNISFSIAIRVFDIGIAADDAGTAPAPIGYDLDNFCTVAAGKNSCLTNQTGRNFDLYVKDKNDHGVDNAGFELVRFMALLGDAFDPVKVNQRLQLGEFGGVAVVSGYNGEADDDNVNVEFYPSLGLERPLSGIGPDGGFIPIGAVVPPRFDPSDRWMRDTAYRLPFTSDGTQITDASAYVVGGKLVARFPVFAMAITVPDNVQRLDIRLQDAVIVGDVVGTDTDGGAKTWSLANAVIGGRWAASEILSVVRPLYISRTSTHVCDDPEGVYKLVKSTMCVARDIALTGNGSPDVQCDALSAGLRAETYAVDGYGRWVDRADAGNPCVDAGVPAGDNCP